LIELMPGANCGACGYPGCADAAEHIVAGDVSPEVCTSCDAETFEMIGELLGMDISAAEPMYPVTICQGGKNCKDRYDYIGADTCKAAILLSGTKKSCSYGCIGLGDGDCVRACMFDAIEIADNELPRIKKYNCKGCGACVTACPQDVLTIAKEHGPVYVVCASHDKGKYVKEVCEFGCIGCGICKKNLRVARQGQVCQRGLRVRMHRMRNLQEEVSRGRDQTRQGACRDRSGEMQPVRDLHRGLPKKRDREAVSQS